MFLTIIIPLLCSALAFGLTVGLVPAWIRHARAVGLVGRDMNKPGEVMVAEGGGVVVVFALVAGLVLFAAAALALGRTGLVVGLAGAIGTVGGAAVIGIVDDLGGWKVGLRQWQKPLLTILAAIPFAVAQLGRTDIGIPFAGVKQVGLLFPLVFVPVAVVGASNAFNMLAGLNGLETGMGMVILGVFGVLSWLNGQGAAAGVCLVGLAALGGFLVYNRYPARVFPGDTMTYPVGAFLAVAAVLGRIESYALILFIPYYLDFLLPLQKRLKVEAFARVNPDGSLELPHPGIYDIVHLAIWVLKRFGKKVYERTVVTFIIGFEFVLGAVCIALALAGRR